jgi:hypothetical protein
VEKALQAVGYPGRGTQGWGESESSGTPKERRSWDWDMVIEETGEREPEASDPAGHLKEFGFYS